jgi:hypothetical protein
MAVLALMGLRGIRRRAPGWPAQKFDFSEKSNFFDAGAQG